MKKYYIVPAIFIVFVILIIAVSQIAISQVPRPLIYAPDIKGSMLHTFQEGWKIADETTTASTEPTALDKDDERTYKQVVALIAAASSGDDEISIFYIPASWNGLKFRSIAIANQGTVVNQIYFGTLGGSDDCDLTYAAQLTWTTGDQDSMYHQIAFTSGGTYEPRPGDMVTGNTSGKTAIVVSTVLSGGAWADGDAAGTIQYRSETGTFVSETVKIDSSGTLKSNVLTHAATDLVQFEYADGLVIVAKAWSSIWLGKSPADDTLAEAKVDRENADVVVIVTETSDADSKLLIAGY